MDPFRDAGHDNLICLERFGFECRASVSLPAVDLIKQVTADFVTDEPKGIVKGAARGDDAEVVVEHHERTADGIDDGIRERNFRLLRR